MEYLFNFKSQIFLLFSRVSNTNLRLLKALLDAFVFFVGHMQIRVQKGVEVS